MAKIISFRTKVHKRATQIRLETGKRYDICLMISWKVYNLIQRMKVGEVRFAYEKKEDGTLRYAVGTLKGIPDGAIRNGEFRDRDWHRHYKTIPYYDVEAKEFRCFKAHLFLKAYDEDQPVASKTGINIEVTGYENDGSLSTAYLISELLKKSGLKVNLHVPQKAAKLDYDAVEHYRTPEAVAKLLVKKKINLTYFRRTKYKRKLKHESKKS